MNTPETALPGKHTGTVGQLYMAFELSDKKWLLVASDEARGPSRYTVPRAVVVPFHALAQVESFLRPLAMRKDGIR